ncbi:MAG: rhodanese-like domain-containing protein [Planctomycetota bacterium]
MTVLVCFVAGTQPGLASEPMPSIASTDPAGVNGLASFIQPEELKRLLAQDGTDGQAPPRVVLIDARDPLAYASGHLPGAINLEPDKWRTPKTKPGQGLSQYVYRQADGSPDVAYYERMLGEAGVRADDTVVVYGNHAGKKDGTVPAMLLDWLGQERVRFLDGVGVDRWRLAGGVLATETSALEPTTYRADPRPGFVWNEPDVLDNLTNPDVVMYDTRSLEEWTGENKRGNARGGHLPGAMRINYTDMLTDDKRVKSADAMRAMLEAQGVTRDKQVVLYCQTATRVSLPYLVMRDLGYPRVSIYDASWFEWGNRDDTPIDREAPVNPG